MSHEKLHPLPCWKWCFHFKTVRPLRHRLCGESWDYAGCSVPFLEWRVSRICPLLSFLLAIISSWNVWCMNSKQSLKCFTAALEVWDSHYWWKAVRSEDPDLLGSLVNLSHTAQDSHFLALPIISKQLMCTHSSLTSLGHVSFAQFLCFFFS